MTFLKIASLLLISACCLLGCGRGVLSPGAYPQEIGYDYLLPDGKRWQYDLVLPRNVVPGDVLTLEIRRFLIDDVSKGVGDHGTLPVDQANKVWLGGTFKLGSSNDRVRVSLQLLDLRDYSTSSLIENPIKLVGGWNVAGGIGNLRGEESFVVGESRGLSASSQCLWRDNEIRLLRFWSATNEHEYTYDVCVRLKKSK